MTLEEFDFEVAMLIADKQSRGDGPVQADMLELLKVFPDEGKENITSMMRQLARQGKYAAHISINKIPILTMR